MSGSTAEKPRGPRAVWEAAKALDAELVGLSWNGFNLFGDRKSIDELQRLMNLDAVVDSLRARLKETCQ